MAGRRGVSILEVLIALSIFVAAVAILVRLSDVAQRFGNRANELTKAQILCENKINELAAGTVKIEPASMQPFDPDAENDPWKYSVEIADSNISGLIAVNVQVFKQLDSETEDEAGLSDSSSSEPKPLCEMARFINDPNRITQSDETDDEVESDNEPNIDNESQPSEGSESDEENESDSQ